MKRVPKFLKNKYIVSSIVFLVYVLLLDDYDIFSMVRYHSKLSEINQKIEVKNHQNDSLDLTYSNFNKKGGIERFAREKKFFKKENEDIFVIFYE